MTERTRLDEAHAAMQADDEDETARLAFYERLASCELFLMLQAEPDEAQDTVTPEVFELDGASYVLVFDCEERLVAFSGTVTPYVALSGRAIAQMLSGQGIGIGLNLEVAPSSILLPAGAIDWLADTLAAAPDTLDARIKSVAAPAGLPERLVTGLDARLASAAGLAQTAYLVSVTYADGGHGHLLGFVGSIPEAQTALAQAVSEALSFSGIEAGSLDVSFFDASDPLVAKLEKVGLRFDLPQPQAPVTSPMRPPGSDPEKPPRLK